MKFHLNKEEMYYFSNLFLSISQGEGVNRSTRRNLERLANKFMPPRVGVYLKPVEKMQVINYAQSGLKIMEAKFTEDLPEDQKQHIEKVYTTIEGVLEKLTGVKKQENLNDVIARTAEVAKQAVDAMQEVPSESANTGT